ncbi:LysR family transcriptional regulator [Ferrimonas sp. YFM]|uniref:LysR family transcriptional regulator n=1 Tax=Ferrimonas sp. YFM TaxID=3028878 RepID=UPI002572CC08|nr:LysR family transcriptional regulator [Ferrimonas sp. YFM]BDY05567.1 LysR family transcriptional regulator [Ferrimonas sp. YFM]
MQDINSIDLNLLKALKVLLQERSVSRAAQRMQLSQSAMSHTLARLRQSLDDPLFVRSGAGLEPTPRALALQQPLELLLEQLNTLLSPPEGDPRKLIHRYRIATHDFMVEGPLAQGIRALRAQHPAITLELSLLDSHSNQALDNGELDLIIGAGLGAKPRFVQKRLQSDAVVCVLDSAHPALTRWPPDVLLQHPLVLHQQLNLSQPAVTELLQECRVAATTGSLQMQLPLLPGSDLIALLPESLAQRASEALGLATRPCPLKMDAITITAHWHQRAKVDAGHRWVREILFAPFLQGPNRQR